MFRDFYCLATNTVPLHEIFLPDQIRLQRVMPRVNDQKLDSGTELIPSYLRTLKNYAVLLKLRIVELKLCVINLLGRIYGYFS